MRQACPPRKNGALALLPPSGYPDGNGDGRQNRIMICGPKTDASRVALRNLWATRGRRPGKGCRNGCCIVQSISAT